MFSDYHFLKKYCKIRSGWIDISVLIICEKGPLWWNFSLIQGSMSLIASTALVYQRSDSFMEWWMVLRRISDVSRRGDWRIIFSWLFFFFSRSMMIPMSRECVLRVHKRKFYYVSMKFYYRRRKNWKRIISLRPIFKCSSCICC